MPRNSVPVRAFMKNCIAIFISILLAGLAPSAFAGFSTVVIDAGHGGHDRGGIPGQRASEKAATLDVAQRLQMNLRAAGLRTVMTRSDDVFVSLPNRVAIANAQRNAIFVSIHFNSAKRSGAGGFETYYYTRQSAALAARLYSRLVRAWPGENRGVKRRGFYVIRKTRIPAALCECGFLTNPHEAALISRPETRQRIADLLAQAIIQQSDR